MGLISKFKDGLSRGSTILQGAFDRLAGRKKISEDDLLDLEEALFACDFGPTTTEEILDEIQNVYKQKGAVNEDDAISVARSVLVRALRGSEGKLEASASSKPTVICLVGVNGSGKTTTCAKLGHLLQSDGYHLIMGACDTFRAAATEQLKAWSSRLRLDLITGHHGSDAAAVAFDAHASAEAKNADFLLLDTAGRLHVKDHLMDELAKLKRVLQKRDEQCPHHSWLVVDGSTGTNGLSQARIFHEKFGLTGLVVTKLDGTSKGGALVSIYRELKLPVYFIGLGEKPEDLQPFSIDAYVQSLLPESVDQTT